MSVIIFHKGGLQLARTAIDAKFMLHTREIDNRCNTLRRRVHETIKTHAPWNQSRVMYFHIILNKYFEFTWQMDGLI